MAPKRKPTETTAKSTGKKGPKTAASTDSQLAQQKTRNATRIASKNLEAQHETNEAHQPPQQDDAPSEDQVSTRLFNGHPATIHLDSDMSELGHMGQLGGEWSLDCWHKNQNGHTICLSTSNTRKRKAVHIEGEDDDKRGVLDVTMDNGRIKKKPTLDQEPTSKRVKTGDPTSTNRPAHDDALTEEFLRGERINKTEQAILDLTIQLNREAPSVMHLRRLRAALDRLAPSNEPPVIEPATGPTFRGRRRWGYDRPIPGVRGQWQYATYDGESSSEYTAQMNVGTSNGFENVPHPSAQQVYELRQTLRRQGHGDGRTRDIDLVWVPDGQDTEMGIDSARSGITTAEPSKPNLLSRPQPLEPPLVTETKHALNNVAWAPSSANFNAAALSSTSEQDHAAADPTSAPAKAQISAVEGRKTGASKWDYDTNPTRKTLGVDIRPEDNPGAVMKWRTRSFTHLEKAAEAGSQLTQSAQETSTVRPTKAQNSSKAQRPAPKQTKAHIPGLVNYEPPGDRSAADKHTARQQSIASQETQLPAIPEEKSALEQASECSGKQSSRLLDPRHQRFPSTATDQVSTNRNAGNRAASGSQRAQVHIRQQQNVDSTQMSSEGRRSHRNQAAGRDVASANTIDLSVLSDATSDSDKECVRDEEDADAQANVQHHEDAIDKQLDDGLVDVGRQLQDVAEDDDSDGASDPLAVQQTRSRHAHPLVTRRESEARRRRGELRGHWVGKGRKNTTVEQEQDETDESESSSNVSDRPQDEAPNEDADHDSGHQEAPRSSSDGTESESSESDSEDESTGFRGYDFREAEKALQEAIEDEEDGRRMKDEMDRLRRKV